MHPYAEYIAAGLSVIPVGTDKIPVLPSWGQFQKRTATPEEVKNWASCAGIAIVAGKVSGGLTCIDIDIKADPLKTIDKEFFGLLKEWGAEGILSRCALEKTPSGGWHLLYRSNVSRGSEKLCRAKGAKEAMIETRGEGGYFVCAPTPGWELKHGSLLEIPLLTDEEANLILNAAWALDRNEVAEPEPIRPPRDTKFEGKSPFDDYNERCEAAEMADLLRAHGWKETRQRGDNIHFCRPEKQGQTTSATLHVVKRVFMPFTSSSEFQPMKGYGPAGLFSILEHGGDFKAAARALIDRGYGEKPKSKNAVQAQQTAPMPTGVSVRTSSLSQEILSLYHTPYYPGESIGFGKEMDDHFRVEPGQMNILFGVPSHGKSSWMDALMVNLMDRIDWQAAIFSPENKSPAYHASKLCEIKVGKPMYGQGRMSPDELMAAASWVESRFTFLTANDGGTSLEQIFEKIRELKPQFVVVDPWNRINHDRPASMTETEYIGNALSRTSALAKSLNLSWWYIVHPQKLRRNKDGDIIRPGFYEVSGSAHWGNMADNGILVWRDFENDLTEIETVKVRYRHNGKVGVVKMKFDRPSGRFSPLDAGGFAHNMPESYRDRQTGETF